MILKEELEVINLNNGNMKNLLIATICIALLAGCASKSSSGNQSITVKKTDEGYNFKAVYPEQKTEKVIDYIEGALANDDIFGGEDDRKNGEISLADSNMFYLKAEPGLIVIDFKKQKNSYASYKKMEDLCMGIKEILQD